MDSRKSSLYSTAYENFDEKGSYSFGPLTSEKLRTDPQYVMFQMSRYKHAARLISNKKNVIDIGPGDGIGIPILSNYFDTVSAVDIDKIMIDNLEKTLDKVFHCDVLLHDFSKSPLEKKYESAVAFDVLSLISKENENSWLKNIAASLQKDGVLVIGTQNKNIIHLGNPKNHVDQPNFKNYYELNTLLTRFFRNVIILSMNDETIHSGKRETCQYFLALGISPFE